MSCTKLAIRSGYELFVQERKELYCIYTWQLNKLSKILREVVDPKSRIADDPDNEDGLKYKFFEHPLINKLALYIENRQQAIQN